MAPGKRKTVAGVSAELSAAEETSKRRKSVIDAVAKEFICPISLELPVEPVTAEDGRVYNRADIQKHIDNADDDNLRSPVTGAPMGPTLVPAVQVQNTLHALIEGGAVEDDSAERLKQFTATKKKAEDGDPEAMCDLGDWYYAGCNGLHQDYKQAYVWCSRAAALNSVRGMADKGILLYTGQGVGKDEVEGGVLLGVAAGRDNALACYNLGVEYYDGDSGLPKNHTLAKYWLTKALELNQDDEKNTGVDLRDIIIEICERKLGELAESES
eukprot:CAMPEP_0178632020 /NCGR_PEP_ID=MMETSP0698-20121128/11314_1 /TAXON_ID=265572 /ORGANISM="Extubocellulus spinifer, Strain CCMP396" /LENGTH=269 /DNA_ID=CAMNT_0020271473 /DNA_START=40 /DNA_END=849 /DNA_ORIENTATION=+